MGLVSQARRAGVVQTEGKAHGPPTFDLAEGGGDVGVLQRRLLRGHVLAACASAREGPGAAMS